MVGAVVDAVVGDELLTDGDGATVVGGAVEVSDTCGGAADGTGTALLDGVVAAVADEVVVGVGVVFDGGLPWPPLSSATKPMTIRASATTATASSVRRLRYQGVAGCGSGSCWPNSNIPVGSSLGSPPCSG